MTLDFTGRSALITGAASGIGAACARWLDAQGIARLILVDRDAAALEALDLACACERVTGDVADPALWHGLALGQLDHAVINAGIAAGGPIAELDFAEWRRVMAVNLIRRAGLRERLRRRLSGRGGSDRCAALRAG
ncbi:SDR family NAD(P)-dependent oxidoreductase [Leptolyngbya sp. 15MV]|nr:SDR family NAD(P)-dependent oxidoreductase [Leptolyngbya sp. 15MV]